MANIYLWGYKMAIVIAVILAVVLDRYARHFAGGKVLQNLRSVAWLNFYLDKGTNLLEKISIKQPYVIILAAVLPLCIALFLIKLLVCALIGESLGRFLFTFVTLFYFLGVEDVEDHDSPYVLAHETSFGVLFWFAIFNFSGALIYWFLVTAPQTAAFKDALYAQVSQALTLLHALAAWIPARITGFIYALVGNFEPGFKTWLERVRDPKLSGSQVLKDCGQASSDLNDANASASLVDRAFIAWVVLVVVIVVMR